MRRRIGSRCGRTASMPRTASICGSRRKSPASMRSGGRSSSRTGARLLYDRLLLATGAEPVRLTIPGADQPHVSHAPLARRLPGDHRRCQGGAPAWSCGASFIGLEVAARSAPARLEVHVVAPDKTADGEGPRPADGRFHPRAARGARRGFPPRGHGERHRRQAREAEERRHARG